MINTCKKSVYTMHSSQSYLSYACYALSATGLRERSSQLLPTILAVIPKSINFFTKQIHTPITRISRPLCEFVVKEKKILTIVKNKKSPKVQHNLQMGRRHSFPLSLLSIMWHFFLLSLLTISAVSGGPEEAEGVKYANKCEVCKVVAHELEARLNETGKTHDVLELGYSVDDVTPKKKKEYRKSELRLLESLENVCERILKYNIHKEREDSTRFSKGMSQTFKTLHGLVDKGVKVELGIPIELWDKPSVEITTLKTQCEDLLENHESDIEEWYYNKQGVVPLSRYLCSERALKDDDDSCLKEKGDKSRSEKPKVKRQKKTSKGVKKNSKENAKNAKEEL